MNLKGLTSAFALMASVGAADQAAAQWREVPPASAPAPVGRGNIVATPPAGTVIDGADVKPDNSRYQAERQERTIYPEDIGKVHRLTSNRDVDLLQNLYANTASEGEERQVIDLWKGYQQALRNGENVMAMRGTNGGVRINPYNPLSNALRREGAQLSNRVFGRTAGRDIFGGIVRNNEVNNRIDFTVARNAEVTGNGFYTYVQSADVRSNFLTRQIQNGILNQLRGPVTRAGNSINRGLGN